MESKKPLNENVQATADWLTQARSDEPKEVSKIKERSSDVIDRYNKLLKELQNRERKLIVIQKEISMSEELIEPLEQVFSQVEQLVEAAPPVSFEAQDVEAHLEKIKVECSILIHNDRRNMKVYLSYRRCVNSDPLKRFKLCRLMQNNKDICFII